MKAKIQRFLDHYKAGLITPVEFVSLVEQLLDSDGSPGSDTE